jgi:acetyl esterase/lipase
MALPQQRAAGEQAESLSSEPTGVTTVDAPEVGGFWSVAHHDAGRVMLYLFGGGYVISSPLTRRKLAGHLAEAIAGRVLVPAYRLAPEHPFPAAVEDATAAYRWLLGQGIAPDRVVLAGDSSGGGLCVATLLAIRDAGLPMPAGATPISPWVDLACTGNSLEQNAQADLTVTKASLQRMAGQYLHGADPRTPLASPLYGDFHGLPPLFITVGGAEALLDDAVRLARAAGMAGTNATLRIVAGMQHIFPIYFGYLPEADAAVRIIGEWVRQQVAPIPHGQPA